MRNAGLNELQAGIKIGGRNINNLRYVDDTTLMAECKEELESLLILPASESFPMSQLFAQSGQSTGVSALASFLPKKSQG